MNARLQIDAVEVAIRMKKADQMYWAECSASHEHEAHAEANANNGRDVSYCY